MDALDLRLLQLYVMEPKAGLREYARRLNVARGTAQARMAKLVESGIISSLSPTLDPASLGFPLSADIHVTLQQAKLDEVVAELQRIPFILRADSLAGAEDVSCRVVAADHEHLERISVDILRIPGVERTRTDIVLRRRIQHRVLPLLQHVIATQTPGS